MKRNTLIILLSIATGIFSSLQAQNDCPSLPSRAKFDTLGFISANVPTDPSNPEGKLYLGQGWANRGGIIRPGFIPSNKPSWAIATAVAWNLGRNMVQRVEYPNMNYWMATLIQETELRCATGMTWDDPSKVPDAYDPVVVYAAQINNGCLQIEGPGSAWSALQQAYPNGRIPISADPGTNTALYDQIIEGVDGFEGSALVKTYYDAYTSQIFNYNVGWDFYENVDCKQNNGHDPYAYTKMSASNYNGGPNGFLGAEGILNQTGPGTWTGLPATTAGYANDIAKWVSVLEDNTTYAEYPAGSSWGGWYDDAVPYSEVTKYIDLIRPMFPDVDIDGEMVPDVEAAFIAKAGSLAGTINFSDFGEVVDAIVLNIPNDKPTPVDGSPIGIDLGCTGDFLPYGHVDILNGTTTMCLGRSVTLELIVDAGNDPAIEFKWFKGDPVTGTLIGTNKEITITPTALGTEVYSGQICNGNGCYTVYSNNQNGCQDPRNLNGFTVTANDCNLCPFTASGVAVNAVCKGTPDGSITLTLNNEPANYRITYIATTPVGNDTVTWETSGGEVQIDNIRDGAYNFTLEDLTDPDCIAYTSVLVGYDTDINEYIDAELLGIADCEADLGAEIKELPAPCLWKVQVHTPIYFQWESWVNAVVKTSTGKTLIQKSTRISPAGEFDPYTNTPISEFWLSLNTGDEITVGTALTTTPGASQLRAYEFNIFDEANTNVYTATSPAGSAKFGVSPDVGTYTVTCPQDVPNYNIAWAPAINNEVTTATNSTGDVQVQNDDRVYYVTATNVTNPQCILKDSVVVTGDPACGSVCANPGTVTLTDLNDVKLTDTVRSCSADTTIKALLAGNDPGTFLYELYKDDVAQAPTNTTGEFTLDAEGTYYVLVSDNADAGNTDCHVYSDTIELILLTPPAAPVLNSGNISVCAGTIGEEYIIDRVDGALTYAWSFDGTNTTFNPANPTDTIGILDFASDATGGTLKVVASNSCGADSLEVAISVDPVPSVSLGNDTAICNGTTLTLDALNATALFEWNDATTDQTLDVTTAGIYWVAVTENSCSDTDSIEVTVNAMPTVDLGNDTSICAGDVTWDVTTAGATYLWHDKSVNPTFTGDVSIDPIWVAITVNGCSDTDSVALSVGGELQIDLGRDTTICANAAPFQITIPNYATIEWTDDLANAGAGTTFDVNDSTAVYLRIEDATGCIGRDTIIVDVNPLPTVDLGPPDTNICAASGALTLDAGNAGAFYLWEPNAEVAQTIDVSASGEYKVEVTVDGCSTRDSMDVTVLGSVILDLGNDTTLCTSNGDLTLDAGLGFTTYEWEAGPMTQDYVVNTTGEYRIRVEDANGCEAFDTIQVTYNTNPVVDLGGDTIAICNTSPAVDFDAGNAGANFVWSSGENTQVINKGSADEGMYKVVVTANNCSDSDSIYLKVDTELTVDLGPADTSICTGTTITLDAGFGAGYTYDWNGAGPTNDKTFETGAGLITVEVADAGGCTGDAQINVLEVNPLSIDLGNDTAICAGDAAVDFGMVSGRNDVTLIGWHDASTDFTFSSDAAGIFTLEVDSAGCRATAQVELTVNPLPVVDLGLDTFVCAGVASVITLDAGAFTTYQWESVDALGVSTALGNAQTEDVTVIGTYVLSVTDVNSCVNTDTILVEERIATAIDLSPQDTVICPAGAGTVTVPLALQGIAGASWVWTNDGSNGASYIVDNELDGASVDVTLEYTNEFGCVTTEIATVVVNNNLPVSLRDTAICEGADITFASGYPAAGYTYTWQDASSGNDFTITGATMADAGNISVNVVSDEGCTGDATVTLTINALPIPVLTPASICDGEEAELDHGLANVTSVWSNGEIVNPIYVNTAGNYEVTVTDANGCENTTDIDVQVNANPVFDLGLDDILCEGEIKDLATLDEVVYDAQWSGASNANTVDIQATQTGTYSVIVTETLTGCNATDEVTLTFNEVPNVELGPDSNICTGDPVLISLSNPQQGYSFEWSNGATTSSIDVDQGGTYVLVVSNGSCSDSDSVVINAFDLPESRLVDDTIICFDDLENGLNLNPGRVGYSYQWSTGDTTQVINVSERGTYIVDIYNQIGCVTQDHIVIKEDCPAHVWLPNAITADGNGINDVFTIEGRGVESVNVLLYNRWGELIWEGNGIGDSWDGTHQSTGLEVQQDVYVYKLTYSYLNVEGGKLNKQRVGHVALIR